MRRHAMLRSRGDASASGSPTRSTRETEHASVRHRVARVQHQIQEHLLELRAAAVNVELPRHVELQSDPAAERTPEHGDRAADDFAEIERAAIAASSLREREQVASELRSAVERLPEIGKRRTDLDVAERQRRRSVAQVGHVRFERREQILEIVRRADAEPADGFQTLAFDEAVFGNVHGLKFENTVRSEAQLVSGCENSPVDARPVHEGAVAALQVLDLEALGRAGEPSVLARDLEVVEHDGRVGGASERRVGLEAKSLPTRGSLDADELGGRWNPREALQGRQVSKEAVVSFKPARPRFWRF